MPDITDQLKGKGISLEKEAFGKFGAAVGNLSGNNLGPALGLNKLSANNGSDLNSVAADAGAPARVWDTTKYAAEIGSFVGQYDPKSKFLFKVSFNFHPDIVQKAGEFRGGIDTKKLTEEMNFVVKQIDLPKIEFEYEEVNMYNFKTKVLKSIKNRELNLTFYDDTGNRAIDFINLYMMFLKPVTRKEYSPSFDAGNHGMAFSENYSETDTAFRGVLPGNTISVLSTIIIEQYYMRLGEGSGTYGDKMRINRFILTNPRLQSFDIGDHDHEAGGVAATIAAAFDFDMLHIDSNQNAGSSKIKPHPKGDLGLPESNKTSSIAGNGQTTSGGGGASTNLFTDNIALQGARKQIVPNLSNLGNPGGGLNASTSNMGGMLGEAGSNTLRNISNGVSQGFARPNAPVLGDNATPSELSQELIDQVTTT